MGIPLSFADWLILAMYFVGTIMLGLSVSRNRQTAEDLTAGSRSLPGWVCGLSIFATYLSSISYLALPGKAFVSNWNFFLYSVAIPPAAWLATRYFVPLYRRSKDVSAYGLLERRFGLWARLLASSLYLLFHIARAAVVMYLMALPLAILFGWDIRLLIIITGGIVTGYAFLGGLVAVIWADAVQAMVLMVGAVVALGLLFWQTEGGILGSLQIASDAGRLSFGETDITIFDQPTVWIVLLFGLFDNIRNFGIDQSYIQRYVAAKDDHQATRSAWLGALLYVPVSAIFFLMGSALYSFYSQRPDQLDEVRELVAGQKLMQEGISAASNDYSQRRAETAATLKSGDLGDRVFPHFIARNLPWGLRGLLIAAIFSAAMSTVSTSLNSSATLVMSDFYRRLLNKDATDAQQVTVVRSATLAWGLFGTLTSLMLVRLTESALDVWWTFSSVLGAGIVGLFLMAVCLPKANRRIAVIATLCGLLLIAWMTLSISDSWPESLSRYASPFHKYLIIVIGPLAMLGLAAIIGTTIRQPTAEKPADGET